MSSKMLRRSTLGQVRRLFGAENTVGEMDVIINRLRYPRGSWFGPPFVPELK